ncbi:NADH dehydrogenase subunit G [Ectothiorhodospira mobilis]|uniref:NADH-quinone oxidoreductase n=1 Tax=Ectothiorhodospira mobilis TaxID=195064 RepID=A0A1I4Q4Q6_ECTMO|nr:NADH-quinone oxidoreductase subunit NuoG [Ectothiorhodospira mobilis]SFM34645.1 NADH dehydrogenase subunit G [Ectothiorhodospira mobilis]
MSEDLVNIEVDGIPLKAKKGTMLIRVTDEAGIRIPRFCYHDKLSVAANCRMCLVEVEKAPKPMPACATPVAEGMRVWTRSPKALAAQKATMEFLLINHPLDCPVCDQGGECELQDVSMGYGEGISRYSEAKRAVKDKDIGPLIATEMTRCIHCTRCVRFGEEIAGLRELGATGRGEFMEIGTFVEKSVTSELSGNVIDLCPVGALTAKPSRFTYRAWELVQHASVAPHDGVGSNIHLHTYNGRVMRVVPRHNEAVNETWISDRDRFSYTGLGAADRLTAPMIREGDQWVTTDWETALTRVVEGLRGQPAEACGALLSPQASVEELYLAQQWLRGLGVRNLDHRLRQSDFSDQDRAPLFPYLGDALEALEQTRACLLVGSEIRKDQPLAGHRLRKAALGGARVMAINPRQVPFNFPVAETVSADPRGMVLALAGVARAALERAGRTAPEGFKALLQAARTDETVRAMAQALAEGEGARVLLGVQAHAHPHFALLRALAGLVCETTGATLGYLPDGGNGAGAWLAGAVAHRGPAGESLDAAGQTPDQWLQPGLKGCLLLNVEPDMDCEDPARVMKALGSAAFVAALTPFAGEALKRVAHVLLPVATFAETSGTYVNVEGRWQSVAGAAQPPGETRPAWKVLRVLGNMSGLEGFEYLSSEEVRDALKDRLRAAGVEGFDTVYRHDGASLAVPEASRGLQRIGAVGPYGVDSLVRRAAPLQATQDAGAHALARIHPRQARSLGLEEGDQVEVRQEGLSARLPLALDEAIPEGCLWLPVGVAATRHLGRSHGAVELNKV